MSATRVGPYEVLFELAQGGMGAVFLARAVGEPVGASGFERVVAIKRLHAHLSTQPESVQRFLDEAKVAARIHHANVASVHQVGSDDAGHFLVQEYIEGDSLQGLVDRATLKRTRVPPPIALRIAMDALSGIHAVHEATDAEGRTLGILHRDVSPQNLLVGRDGVTRLADFGIAKHALRTVVTDGQYLQGRVLCMPPEYLARRPIDRRFDVYGMGITLWTALTGEAPWAEASDAQIVHLAVNEGVPPLSSTGLAVAPPIEAIVARACRRDPEQRFASARAMLDAIEEVGRHTGWIASHAEVAALVEQLAGRELTARRAAVARARGSADPTPSSMSVRSPEARPRGRGTIAIAAGAIVALGVAAAAITMKRATATRAATAASASAMPEPTATAAPAPTATVTPTATAAPEPTAASSALAPLRRFPPKRAAAPKPSASVVAPSMPVPPSGISTANPYR